MCVVSCTSTLHRVLERSKALGALVEAAPFVQVKPRLALGAEVFTEAGLAVVYPAPWRKKESVSATISVSSGVDRELRGLGKGGS